MVASPSKGDGAALAGLVGDGGYARLGGELGVAGEAFADVARLGEDLGGAGTRKVAQ